MELQWPLIIFTTLVAWAAGIFGAQGALAMAGGGAARKSQMPALIMSVVVLAISGIAVFFHLEHWERIFNGFGHLTSGITQELIAIVVFVIVAVVYFACLRKSGDGTVPKATGAVAIVISVVLAAMCAHSYTMAARPAWDSPLEVLSIVGAACLMGPATMGALMAMRGDDVKPLGSIALIAGVIGTVCVVAFAAFLQFAGGSFASVGYYFDPTHPTKAMADAAATVGSQTALIWAGGALVGAVVPLVAAFLAKKQGTAAGWKLWGAIAVIAALAGAILLRVAFYNLGMSVFMFY